MNALGAAAGTSHVHISRMEDGKNRPSLAMILKIAEALGIDPAVGIRLAFPDGERKPDPETLLPDEEVIIAGFRNAPPDDKEIMRLMAKRNLPPESKIEPGHMQPGEMDEMPDD